MKAQIYCVDHSKKVFGYLNKSHEKKYVIKFYSKTNKILIRERKTDLRAYFSPSEFVHGQGMYNTKTEKYPNYVHKAVWMLYEQGRKI